MRVAVSVSPDIRSLADIHLIPSSSDCHEIFTFDISELRTDLKRFKRNIVILTHDWMTRSDFSDSYLTAGDADLVVLIAPSERKEVNIDQDLFTYSFKGRLRTINLTVTRGCLPQNIEPLRIIIKREIGMFLALERLDTLRDIPVYGDLTAEVSGALNYLYEKEFAEQLSARFTFIQKAREALFRDSGTSEVFPILSQIAFGTLKGREIPYELIKRETKISAPTLLKRIGVMQDEGLVTVRAHVADRRKKFLSLTPYGKLKMFSFLFLVDTAQRNDEPIIHNVLQRGDLPEEVSLRAAT